MGIRRQGTPAGIIANCETIEMISFSGNQVTDAGLRYLESLPRLREIQPDELMTREGYNRLVATISNRQNGR